MELNKINRVLLPRLISKNLDINEYHAIKSKKLIKCLSDMYINLPEGRNDILFANSFSQFYCDYGIIKGYVMEVEIVDTDLLISNFEITFTEFKNLKELESGNSILIKKSLLDDYLTAYDDEEIYNLLFNIIEINNMDIKFLLGVKTYCSGGTNNTRDNDEVHISSYIEFSERERLRRILDIGMILEIDTIVGKYYIRKDEDIVKLIGTVGSLETQKLTHFVLVNLIETYINENNI